MPDSYVPAASWLRPTGRADAIDDVADQFERRRDVPEAFAAPVDLASRRPATAEPKAARLAG